MRNTIENKLQGNEKTGEVVGRHMKIERRGATQTNSGNDEKDNSLSKRFRRNAGMFMLGLGLTGYALGLGGCATTGTTANMQMPQQQQAQSGIGYDKFYDSYGDYRLISRNNDIYMEKLDGSESRRVTNTPDIGERENWVHFVLDGKGIVYAELTGRKIQGVPEANLFYIDSDKDDNSRRQISGGEFNKLWGDQYYKTHPK